MNTYVWKLVKAYWRMNFMSLISVLHRWTPSDPNRLFSEEIVEIVNRTLGELPEKTRKAFVMSRYQNKSVKEIAGLLDVTVKGADYHIGKALQALRKSLKDYLSSFLFF